MTEVYVPVSTLRQDVKHAEDKYERAKTYDNALALQKVREALENFFRKERTYFLWFRNPNPVPNTHHVAPSHWRVIDGGKAYG